MIEKILERFRKASVNINIPIDVDSWSYIRAISKCEAIVQEVAKYGDWIPVEVAMPTEHDSIFAKYSGTKKWNEGMFEKISDTVNVTVIDDKGMAVTTYAHTVDGIWSCDLLRANNTYRIVAWQPLPAPFKKGE